MRIRPHNHVVGEGDEVLLITSPHRDEEVVGVDIAHVYDRRIHLDHKGLHFLMRNRATS